MTGTVPALSACLDALGDNDVIVEGIVAQRDNSRIYQASVGGRGIAIKQCFAPSTRSPDSAAAQREYDALMKVTSVADASGQDASVPLPLSLDRVQAVYAMTWIRGRTMTDLLLAPATSLAQAAELGEAAGRWLQQFHGLHALPPRQADYESRVDFVNRLAASAGARDRAVRRAARLLAERASAAAAQTLPASWVHGDMKSDNLLVDGERVTGLDVQLVDENNVTYDIAPFLNHLRLLRWTPRGLRNRRKLQSMADRFLRAYSPEAIHWRLPLSWLRVYLLIQRRASAVGARSVHAAIAGWSAGAELAAATEELAQCP